MIPFSRNFIVNNVNILYIVCIIVVLASFFVVMSFDAACCCLRNDEWLHSPVTKANLRYASRSELLFTKTDERHTNRKLMICLACRSRLESVAKIQKLELENASFCEVRICLFECSYSIQLHELLEIIKCPELGSKSGS